MNKYKKITQDDVFKCVCSCDLALFSPGIVSAPNIASLLKTSKYQVRKHLVELKKLGLVKSDSVMIYDEYENFPPYNGFCLTGKGRETSVFIELDRLDRESYQKWDETQTEI